MSAAQRDNLSPEDSLEAALLFSPADLSSIENDAPSSNDSHVELKQVVAARLAAHRARRSGLGPAAVPAPSPATPVRRPNAIAAAVAERYAHSPSYRTFLAEEAERATRQAAAAAEIAARNAEAIASAQQQLLQELEQWNQPPAEIYGPVAVETSPAPQHLEPIEAETPVVQTSAGGLTVRLYEDLGLGVPTPARRSLDMPAFDPDEHLTLDEEIAFRQSPVFEEPAGPTVPIPANLLSFPRQLVAARKARPLLALGPLIETAAPVSGQLRIFEVEPQQVSPAAIAPAAKPEWTSIWLDTPLSAQTVADTEVADPIRPELSPAPNSPQAASLGRRVMSSTVDAVLVLAAFLGFSSFIIALAGSLPVGLPLETAALATLIIFALLYHLLFFTFSDHTPGMSYARIGLCTFSDENPSRAAMRRRLIPTLLAICPLGLGLIWAIFDQEHLGWHDRLSQTYQREY